MSISDRSRPASSTCRHRWSSIGSRSSTVSRTGVFAVWASIFGAANGFHPSADAATRRRDSALFPPIQMGMRPGLGLAVWPRALKCRPS